MWLEGPYSEMWDDEMRRLVRRLTKHRNATVVHQETCPCCGAKLVNLYRRDNEWRCRRCWEKHDADPQQTIKLGSGNLYMVDKDGNHTYLGEVKIKRTERGEE